MWPIPVMLATPSREDPHSVIRRLQRSTEWTFEFKYDGIRAQIALVDGGVTITNRTGRDITFRYPDVVGALTGITTNVVLDGEIVCLDERGRPIFSQVHRRDAQENPRSAAQLAAVMPAHYVPFDVLYVDGQSVRASTYIERRRHLAGLAEILSDHGAVVPPVSADGSMMWDVVRDLGLEGLIAKRNTSRYVGRRSPSWVKIKRVARISALVSGYDRGTGYRASTFGALQLSLVDEHRQLKPIGHVGSGFTDADIAAIWQRLETNDHPIVVDVAYLDYGPNGQLRFPVFKGIRTDLPVTACSTNQLLEHNG